MKENIKEKYYKKMNENKKYHKKPHIYRPSNIA